MTQTQPGSSWPLGATLGEDGTNFAVFSAPATAVTLCLCDEDGTERQIPLVEVDSGVWHGFVPGVGGGPPDGDPGLRLPPGTYGPTAAAARLTPRR